jgi:hypothetical protein
MLGRDFLVNLAIGLALLVVLHCPFVQDNQAVSNLRDGVISWQMDQLRGLDTGPGLAWIDIDEDTYEIWNAPFATPRDKLTDLIKFAASAHPAVIIVDIDLTYPALGLSSEDSKLQNYLRGYVRDCHDSCAPILLVRDFRKTWAWNYEGAPGQGAFTAQRSFLDAAVGTSPDRPWADTAPEHPAWGAVMWGSASMDHDADFVTRRWRLWVDSCSAHGEGFVTPSVMLLAAAIKTHTSLPNVRGALISHAKACEPFGQAAEVSTPPRHESSSLQIGRHPVALSENGGLRRVFYRIPWVPASVHFTPPPDAPRTLVPMSAEEITEKHGANSKRLAGKVVVIGTSTGESESGDMHLTPLGAMPGSLVMINAINALLRGDEVIPANWFVTIAIEVVLILLISVLFTRFTAGPALFLSIVVVVFGSLTLGFRAFNSGVWIDSVVPLAGVILHELVARTHHHVLDAIRKCIKKAVAIIAKKSAA